MSDRTLSRATGPSIILSSSIAGNDPIDLHPIPAALAAGCEPLAEAGSP